MDFFNVDNTLPIGKVIIVSENKSCGQKKIILKKCHNIKIFFDIENNVCERAKAKRNSEFLI